MSSTVRTGKVLIGIGVLLIAIDGVGLASPPDAPLASLAPILDLWWLVILAGVGLALLPRLAGDDGVSLPGVERGVNQDRQDIISATDWARLGRHALRSSYGVALTASAVVLFVVALGLQEFGLVALWVAAAVVGALVIAATWRAAHPIIDEHTETIAVRAPDNFAAHSFHVALRQQAEDLGYRVVTDVSPTEGGRPSAAAERVFHAHGGFEARNRPIEESRVLAPEVDDPYLERILTVATLGVFVALLGVTLVSIDVGGLATTVLGGSLFVVGIAVVAYDYATRTREWAELYCVEEGTVYETTVNTYSDDVLEAFESPRIEPSATTTETAAVLSVTVSATCTPLYGEENVEEDFETLVEAVDEAADEFRFEVVDEERSLAFDESETTAAEATDSA